MGYITQMFVSDAPPRTDGIMADVGLPHAIPPDRGPLAPGSRPDADFPFPNGGQTVLIQTHQHEDAQYSTEWTSFLSYAQVEQSQVITPSRIYVLHKPQGWTPATYGLETCPATEDANKRAEILKRNWNIIHAPKEDLDFVTEEYRRLGGWSAANDKIIADQLVRRQATRYAIALEIKERD